MQIISGSNEDDALMSLMMRRVQEDADQRQYSTDRSTSATPSANGEEQNVRPDAFLLPLYKNQYFNTLFYYFF